MKIINLSGIVGWDFYASDIRQALNDANGEDIEIQISSPGGYVSEGIVIFNLIKNYTGKKTSKIIGAAASMASYIALAADRVIAESNSIFMIHNAMGYCDGDYRDMDKRSKILNSLSGLLAKAYKEKTKKEMSEIRQMMDDETYLFGEEILEAGFCDEIVNKCDEKKEKAEAVLETKAIMETCVAKLKTDAKAKDDLMQVAALIPLEEIKNKNVSEIPANAGTNNKEVSMEKLKDLIAKNPALQNEIDELINAAVKAYKEKSEKACAIISSEAYPQAVKNVALDVVKGTKNVETLDTVVATYDALKEQNKSVEAKKETETQGNTPAQMGNVGQSEGTPKTEPDYQAMVAHMKNLRGGN